MVNKTTLREALLKNGISKSLIDRYLDEYVEDAEILEDEDWTKMPMDARVADFRIYLSAIDDIL